MLAQDYTNRGSGINYYKDDESLMSIDELLDIASKLYFGQDEGEVAKFKQECLDVVYAEKYNQDDENEQEDVF